MSKKRNIDFDIRQIVSAPVKNHLWSRNPKKYPNKFIANECCNLSFQNLFSSKNWEFTIKILYRDYEHSYFL